MTRRVCLSILIFSTKLRSAFFRNVFEFNFIILLSFVSACTGTTEYKPPAPATAAAESSGGSSAESCALVFDGLKTATATSQQSVQLNWDAATGACDSVIYYVYQNGSSEPTTMTSDTSIMIMGLATATRYTYVVTADDGTSILGSRIFKAVTTKTDSLPSFSGIQSVQQSRPTTGEKRFKYAATLNWNAALSTDPTPDRYYIYYSATSEGQEFDAANCEAVECATCGDAVCTDGYSCEFDMTTEGCCKTTSGKTQTSQTFYCLNSDTDYYFSVRASNGTDTEENTIEKNLTTESIPEFYNTYSETLDVDGDGLLPFPYGTDCENDGDGFESYHCGGIDVNDTDPGRYLNSGQGTFAAKTSTTVVGLMRGVYVGDLDNDGDMDVVNTDYTNAKVAVLLNNGTGAFAAAVKYNLAAAPEEVLLADIDGDACLDIVVAVNSGNVISVLMGHCDGTFADAVSINSGTAPVGVVAGDVNGDGKLDIVNCNTTGAAVGVNLNQGDGMVAYSNGFALGGQGFAVTLSDVDKDGDLDIIAIRSSVTIGVVISLNDGTGTFSGVDFYFATGTTPRYVKTGYLNNDDYIDIVVTNYNDANVGVFLNEGTGTGSFNAQVTHNVTGQVSIRDVFLGDVDGDGDIDIAPDAYTSNSASILLNDGDGTFTYNASYASTQPYGIFLADMDGDNILDIITATNTGTIDVLLGN